MRRFAALFLLACAAGPIAACSSDEKTPQEEWIANEQSITHNWQENYVKPLLEGSLELTVDCEHVDAGNPEREECADFVEMLKSIQPTLEDTITGLTNMEPPPSPLQVDSLARLINQLQLSQESDKALIRGWENQDQDEWARGWELQLEASSTIDDLLGTPVPTP